MKNDAIQSIEHFLQKANYSTAINYMKKAIDNLLDNEAFSKEIRAVEGRLANIKKQYLDGLINQDVYIVEFNKINITLIALKDQLEAAFKLKEVNSQLSDVELELLVYANAYAASVEDLEMLIKTMHSEVANQSVNMAIYLFEAFDLIYDIKSIKITDLKEQFATATVVQETRSKFPNPNFRNNLLTTSHSFARENGRWKLYSQIPKKVEYLD